MNEFAFRPIQSFIHNVPGTRNKMYVIPLHAIFFYGLVLSAQFVFGKTNLLANNIMVYYGIFDNPKKIKKIPEILPN